MENHSKHGRGGMKTPTLTSSNNSQSRTNGSALDNKKQDSANNNNNVVGTCEICERGDFTSEAELAAHRKLVHHVRSSSSGKVSGISFCMTEIMYFKTIF